MKLLRRAGGSPVHAKRSHGPQSTPVAPAFSGSRLPGKVLVGPGAYRVGSSSFALVEPGAYIFEQDGHVLEQRIVAGESLDAFLTDVSWLWGYGSRDDRLSHRARRRRALHERVSATCTPLSTDLAAVLGRGGFQARVVLIFTGEELNEVDNGHTLLEVVSGDNWALYDPSFRTFFTRHGRRLSLLEWCTDAVAADDYEIEPLPGGASPLGAFEHRSGSLRERMERLAASEDERRRWYRRVAGAPLVRGSSGRFGFAADDPLAEVLAAYSKTYEPVEPAEFRGLWPGAARTA
jgi:hypothetical protein